MLVLLNQLIVDVGDPFSTLQELGVDPARAPTGRARIVALGQSAAFAAKGLENAHPGIVQTLACLLGMSGEANCGLFLAPPNARSHAEVAVRLAAAPITTLVELKSLQDVGRLTAGIVNKCVWQVAGGEAAA